MLDLLWKYRERPPFASARWWKVWAKRAVTAPHLFGALGRLSKLRVKGAQIEPPAYLSPSIWNGRASNLKVGSGSFVGRVEVHLHDRVTIGRNVVINDGATLLTASHLVDDVDFRLTTGAITIGDHAWVAIGAIIMPGVSVGTGAVVGAGALVSRDVPDYGIAVGNPARILEKSRARGLRYCPLHSLATFEAWLGSNRLPTHAVEVVKA